MTNQNYQKVNKNKQAFFTIKEKINILIVDDNSAAVNLIKAALDSPLIRMETAHSLQAARNKIRSLNEPWNCWVVDLNLGNNESGISLIEEFNYFQFCVVLSGLRNMRLAFEVTKKGALQVYDKTSKIITAQFLEDSYRIAALGYLLRGQRTDYLHVFLTLQNNIITSPREWAENAFVGLRHLENICILHTNLTPRQVIAFYYYLCISLYAKNDTYGNIIIDEEYWKPHFDSKYHNFLKNIIESAKVNFFSIYQQFSSRQKQLIKV